MQSLQMQRQGLPPRTNSMASYKIRSELVKAQAKISKIRQSICLNSTAAYVQIENERKQSEIFAIRRRVGSMMITGVAAVGFRRSIRPTPRQTIKIIAESTADASNRKPSTSPKGRKNVSKTSSFKTNHKKTKSKRKQYRRRPKSPLGMVYTK